MKTNRRRFLGLLGVGAAAGPLAAKAALDETIGSQAGVSMAAKAVGGLGVSYGLPSSDQKPSTPWMPHDQRMFKSLAYIKTFGLPEFLENQFRQQAKWVDRLDIDIAAKWSWSMAVKLQEQRQRNYQRQLAHLDYQSKWYKGKAFIEKILGFEWPF